jgi:glycosyltransferase involved in cell wall biosynthesis
LSNVSVIIPAYNAARFVSNAIESALGQTVAPLEVIVVDDGSRDDTADVVSRFPAPVRLVRQANGGPAAARNHGAREAKGEWLALLDADDTWLPHKLERQMTLARDPKVAVIYAMPAGHNQTRPATFEELWRRNCIDNSSALIRRSAFLELGGFDEDRAIIGVEDYNLWLRLAASGWRMACVPETLHCYTPAPNNLSSRLDHYLSAELANLRKIAVELKIQPDKVQAKELALYDEFGRAWINLRQTGEARKVLTKALVGGPSPQRLAWWLVSLTPTPLLNFRRRVTGGT